MKTRAEIIEEGIRYYEEDPSRRAIDDTGCSYLTEDGRMCIVGRCMVEPEGLYGPVYFLQYKRGTLFISFEDTHIEKQLRPEYRGHPLFMWKDLQDYHDSRPLWRCWEDRRKYVEELWAKWCPDTPIPQFTYHGEADGSDP